jgi:cell division transport system permease protein
VFAFLGFSLRRALQGLWRNRVMSVAAIVTMMLMLLLLSGLLIVVSGLQAGLSFVEQKVDVQAYLNDGVAQDRVDTLMTQVRALPEVAEVTYKSKDQALAEWQQQLVERGQQDLSVVTGTNPIPASINVKLRTPGVYGQVVETLKAPPGVVKRVDETRKVVDAIVSITNVLRTIGLVMLVMVGLTVLFIVVNTIRMAVMARADEIEIMRLVGASDAFIRWPFIFEGLLVGLIGAAVTLLLLLLAAAPISELTNAIVTQVPVGFDQQLGLQLLVLVVAAGAAMGGVGAWISVRSYLIK